MLVPEAAGFYRLYLENIYAIAAVETASDRNVEGQTKLFSNIHDLSTAYEVSIRGFGPDGCRPMFWKSIEEIIEHYGLSKSTIIQILGYLALEHKRLARTGRSKELSDTHPQLIVCSCLTILAVDAWRGHVSADEGIEYLSDCWDNRVLNWVQLRDELKLSCEEVIKVDIAITRIFWAVEWLKMLWSDKVTFLHFSIGFISGLIEGCGKRIIPFKVLYSAHGHITTKNPHLAEFIGRGTFTSLGNRHGIFSQRSVQDSARIYIFISTEDEHFATTTGLSSKTATQARDQLLGEDLPFYSWGSKIKELVAVACDDESAYNPGANIDIKPLYTLPVGHTWEHQPSATAIGDAAHLMNPPAGEGVNIAMRDSLLLSQAIIKADEVAGQEASSLWNVLGASIKEFEVDMVARAKAMAEGTLEVSEMMFGREDGARTMANWFKSMGQTPE
ncbi:hypothetical protein G7Y89_g3464 [Cudoniella acicularis]|uniref:FAD-binding domain-containing protein n=1 Tax=Cudoniella acicularis TaxID=354080 RepID=A0A8H4W5K4_9HELO|nr:hypothetical protein G7Y89_g3464 [Cudoniella acicularis]